MNGSKIIYLATPYMHDNPDVMDFRADVSDIIAAKLADLGHVVFAPISAWHHIAKKYGLPRDWEFWHNFDEQFVKVSKVLCIIVLYGWRESKGTTGEIELANEYGLEIIYIDPVSYITQLKLEKKYNDDMFWRFGRADYPPEYKEIKVLREEQYEHNRQKKELHIFGW